MIRKIYFIILAILCIIGISLGFTSAIIPNVAMGIFIAIYIAIYLLCLFLTKKKEKKKKIIIIFGYILSIILLLFNILFGIIYKEVNQFFNKINSVEYKISNYSLVKIKDNDNDVKTIGIYSIDLDVNLDDAIYDLTKNNDYKTIKYKNIITLINDLLNNKLDAIFINENYLSILYEEMDNIKNKLNTIATIKEEFIEPEIRKEINLVKDKSFNIYISGIDVYGDINNVSRSDVNIIATVDVKNSRILLTDILNDAYVQLDGTTGLKDRLSFAGIYGVNNSIKTIENTIGTNINYYIRINYDSLIKVVDYLGGIDVYSDYAFNVPGLKVVKGMNHFNGKQALRYSMEMSVFKDTNIQRGKNQQNVIKAIYNKVIVNNDIDTYKKIIDTMKDNIQTNIDKDLINSLINLQVNKKYNWSIETQSIIGNKSTEYTYSYSGKPVVVTLLDQNSISTSINKINNYLSK